MYKLSVSLTQHQPELYIVISHSGCFVISTGSSRMCKKVTPG